MCVDILGGLMQLSVGPQVALRIRPLSEAEQEDAATVVAHRLDEQVSSSRTPPPHPPTPHVCTCVFLHICVCVKSCRHTFVR